MDLKLLNRIFAAVVFLISLIVLFMTVQPTVSFWDCGEFIAAAYSLQVPHPPGAPFFLLLGRIFSMVPFAESIAFRINTISVITSGLSVLLLYLIIVKLIVNFRGKPENFFDGLVTFLSAAIGALAFSFSDTFWFNGTEAEVYATSTFLFVLIVYLILLWNERADAMDNEKYILMIAYLLGISTGVHLMAVLAIITVVLIIFFRKYLTDEEALKGSINYLLIHAAILLIVAFALWGSQTGATPLPMEEFSEFDDRFKLIMAGISVVFIAVFWKKLIHRNSVYIAFIIGGIALFATYPGIVKVLPTLLVKVSGDNVTYALAFLAVMLGGVGYGIYYAVKNNKPTMHLVFMSLLFIFLGFSTYAQVKVRSNLDPPMNENEPKDFTTLVKYLNREQYGNNPIFKRRYASDAHLLGIYQNYNSDLDFWWSYQMNHMMTRYLLWNFAGRTSWYQDDGVNVWPLNDVANVIGPVFDIRFSGEPGDSLFGIPFLIGLLGIWIHFRRDWKMAFAFMVLFIFMGYLTAFYQNQQEPQPREREYFYVGAFFVFAAWIGIAVRGLVDIAYEKLKNEGTAKMAAGGIIFLALLFVPVRMLQANYHTHDRSENYTPWDYSYNLLQSCAPDAVLFTNGDNDTFPLWFLQDVEGVRRDIRIANLSLLNTEWYIKQLKNLEPYGAKPVAMRLNDQQISQIRPIQWEPRDITIPVPREVYDEFGVTDSSIISSGAINFRMNNTMQYGDVKAIRVQDLMVREIIIANNWQRPIYFAVTVADDSKIGLHDYLRMEGMAMRLVPMKGPSGREYVNEPVLHQQLFNNPPDDSFSFDYQPGFKLRGLDNPNIFFDENHERLTQNYRNAYLRLSIHYMEQNETGKLLATLNKMDENIPREIIPIDYRLLFDIAAMYLNAGDEATYRDMAEEIELKALQQMRQTPMNVSSRYNPYRILLETYENLGEFEKAIGIIDQLQQQYPDDQSLKSLRSRFEATAALKQLEQETDTVDQQIPAEN